MKEKKKINIIFIIIWLVIIFVMSSFNASESSNQSNFIVNLIIKIFGGNSQLITIIVRDFAHFMEYLILGILCTNLCKKKKDFWMVVIFCIIYAITDEVHQMFVPGRAFQLLDIMIDSLGSFLGLVLYRLIFDKKR